MKANAARYLSGCAMVLAMFAAPACATGYGYGYPTHEVRNVQRIAYDNGYREGVEEGQKDAHKHRPYSLERHDEFRDADHGYHRDYGDRELYRRAYRDGFRSGYNQAFERRGY